MFEPSKKFIYLDNNATTMMCENAKKTNILWQSSANPSSSSRLSQLPKKEIEKAKNYINKHCKLADKYHIIFNSGATEGNSFAINCLTKSYKKILKRTPHLIVSAVEHHSIMLATQIMKKNGDAEITYVYPNRFGSILARDVQKAIKPNTALISIMFANNETGSINNIKAISEVAHKHKIPIHSDCVQAFGKYKIDVVSYGIDILTASFHKLHGPKGVGLLLINKELAAGYKVCTFIYGSQQGGLRGGTENVAGILSSISAMKWAFTRRATKNRQLLKMRKMIIDRLSKVFHVQYFTEKLPETPAIILIGHHQKCKDYFLPNTILLGIWKPKGKEFCNVNFKKCLDKAGVIVSISSACLTKSKNASHVMTAMKVPTRLKKGIIRISLSDMTTEDEVIKFVNIFIKKLKPLI